VGKKLVWKDIGLAFGEFTCYAAPASDGARYVIGVNTHWNTGKFSGYCIEYEASAGVIDRVLGRNLKSAEDAKSLAEKDYASLSK
jgi:hypothetical protein